MSDRYPDGNPVADDDSVEVAEYVATYDDTVLGDALRSDATDYTLTIEHPVLAATPTAATLRLTQDGVYDFAVMTDDRIADAIWTATKPDLLKALAQIRKELGDPVPTGPRATPDGDATVWVSDSTDELWTTLHEQMTLLYREDAAAFQPVADSLAQAIATTASLLASLEADQGAFVPPHEENPA